MVEYQVKLDTEAGDKEITVIASTITHALDLVDLYMKHEDYLEYEYDIMQCTFIKHIDELLIERF